MKGRTVFKWAIGVIAIVVLIGVGAVVLLFVVGFMSLEKGERHRRELQAAQESGRWDFGDQPALFAYLAPATLIRIFSRDPRVIAIGSEYLRIVSLNFISAGIVFTTSSVFQGIGNTLPPLFSSLTRLVLFAVPALLISRMPGFEIREVWYLSVGSIVFQMCVNLLLLRHELRKRLRFDEPENFIPASATAS